VRLKEDMGSSTSPPSTETPTHRIDSNENRQVNHPKTQQRRTDSEFFNKLLEVLLQHLQVETLILTGLTSNSCITVTAHDAHMRGFDIFIPSDCSCARNQEEHAQALAQLQGMAGANLTRSTSLKLPNVIRAAHLSGFSHTTD
jgi:nicotinamidase-related amidase